MVVVMVVVVVMLRLYRIYGVESRVNVVINIVTYICISKYEFQVSNQPE